jgi:hypothetical protein
MALFYMGGKWGVSFFGYMGEKWGVSLAAFFFMGLG